MTFDYIINRKIRMSYGKKLQFLTSKIEHTDDFSRLKIEHIESSKIEQAESLLCPTATIPNLSAARNRQYRISRPCRSFLTIETEDTKDFLQTFVVFVRCSQLFVHRLNHKVDLIIDLTRFII